eukprot:sb/3468755/
MLPCHLDFAQTGFLANEIFVFRSYFFSTSWFITGGRWCRNIDLLASLFGKSTRILFSKRLSMAWSNSQGRLLAANRNTKSSDLASPSIWTSSSVFIRRDPSCSFDPALLPPLWDMRDSNSSTNIVEGAWYLANSNSTRTNFSESPLHLLTMLLAEMLKNVVLHSVAMALANSVLPVPGGPYNRRPFQGDKIPGTIYISKQPIRTRYLGHVTAIVGMVKLSFEDNFSIQEMTHLEETVHFIYPEHRTRRY